MTPLTARFLYDLAFLEGLDVHAARRLMQAADRLAYLEACSRELEGEHVLERATLVPSGIETEQGP